MYNRGGNITATAGAGLLDVGATSLPGGLSKSDRDGGSVVLKSGGSDFGDSGNIKLMTEVSQSLGSTGSVDINTGHTYNDVSGDIPLKTGNSDGEPAGKIAMKIGTTSSNVGAMLKYLPGNRVLSVEEI